MKPGNSAAQQECENSFTQTPSQIPQTSTSTFTKPTQSFDFSFIFFPCWYKRKEETYICLNRVGVVFGSQIDMSAFCHAVKFVL